MLSCRVYLLPQDLEQDGTLQAKFHLDERWDSANNKPLIAKMPSVFQSPSDKPLAEGKTRYLVPFGKGAVFDGDKGIASDEFFEGQSERILILEVGEEKAVTWTKPDDMDFDPRKPKAGLGTIGADGFPVAFVMGADGIVGDDIDAEVFRRMILRNDGVPADPKKR